MWTSILYYWWIPFVMVLYFLAGYLSTLASQSWKWVGILMVVQFLGLWPIVARYSKNIAADGILYDVILLGSMYGAFWYFGQMDSFSILQWVGLGLAIIGVILMKGVI